MTKQTKKFADLTYLLIVLSLAITLVLWNGFAKQGAAATDGQTASTANDIVLPTLIPLSDIALPDKPQQVASPDQTSGDQPLREVSQPETTVVQKKPPVVEQVSIGSAAPAASSSGEGSAPAPVTTTASS